MKLEFRSQKSKKKVKSKVRMLNSYPVFSPIY